MQQRIRKAALKRARNALLQRQWESHFERIQLDEVPCTYGEWIALYRQVLTDVMEEVDPYLAEQINKCTDRELGSLRMPAFLSFSFFQREVRNSLL